MTAERQEQEKRKGALAEGEIALGIWERDLQGRGWQFLVTWTGTYLCMGTGLAMVTALEFSGSCNPKI